MPLTALLQPGSTLVLPGPATRDEALAALATHAANTALPGASPDALFRLLQRREELSPTSVPEGVAFPHAIDASIPTTVLVVALWKQPVDFGTSAPADLILGMFGSTAEPWRHVRLLARLARIVRAPGALTRLRASEDAEELRTTMLTEDQSHD